MHGKEETTRTVMQLGFNEPGEAVRMRSDVSWYCRDIRREDLGDLDPRVLQLRVKREGEAMKGSLGGAIVGDPRAGNYAEPRGDGNK